MSKDSEKLAILETKLNSALKDRDEIVKRSDETHCKQDETNKTIMEKLDEFGEKLEEVKISIAILPDELTKRFDERYATKKTEVALNRLMWIVITAVVGAVLSLVIFEVK